MSSPRVQAHGGVGRRMRVVAVTGGAGKTTTAWLTASVLAEAGLRVGVVSDLGYVDADGTLADPVERGRPGVERAWLERLARGGCTHAVVEMPWAGFGAGAIGRGSCDAVVVTGGREGCRTPRHRPNALARRIAACLAPGGCLVAPRLPGLAPLFSAVADRPGLTCLTAGLDEACDVSARPIVRSLDGQTFLVTAASQVVPVSLDVPIASYARNALCAAAVGLVHGVPLHVVARGLEAAGSVAGRVERLDRGQDFAAFLDAPPSRQALASTLTSLRRLTSGRLAVVAEQGLVDRLGAAGFAGPVRRWCDEALVVPPGMLADEADEAALAAYARIDRLLGRLGASDCLLVLGAAAAPAGCTDGGMPLATLVDGWLRLACPPVHGAVAARRAA